MTDLLADKIGSPIWRRSFRPERLPQIVFFCLLWTPSDTPSSFSKRTGMSLARVNEELGLLRGYLGIRSGGQRRNNYVLCFAFLQAFAPEEVQGLPAPDLDLAPAPNLRGRNRTLSEKMGEYLQALRAKERLENQTQNQGSHQR